MTCSGFAILRRDPVAVATVVLELKETVTEHGRLEATSRQSMSSTDVAALPAGG